MAPIALGSPTHQYTTLDSLKKLHRDDIDGFGTRAIHVGSDPDPSTGAVIPAISLSTTYKQDGIGNHKVGDKLSCVESRIFVDT
jgi:cystathionine gamma-lyase